MKSLHNTSWKRGVESVGTKICDFSVYYLETIAKTYHYPVVSLTDGYFWAVTEIVIGSRW